MKYLDLVLEYDKQHGVKYDAYAHNDGYVWIRQKEEMRKRGGLLNE